MDFEEGLPQNINNLPRYFVPLQIFGPVVVAIGLFLLTTIGLVIVWIYRVCLKIYNPDYLIDYLIFYEEAKSKKLIEVNSNQNSDESGIKFSKINEYTFWNRVQSRILEFICVSVVVALAIATNSCQIMLIIAFVVSLVLFLVFNMFRVLERMDFLRVLWLIPIIVCYISYYVFDKNLNMEQ